MRKILVMSVICGLAATAVLADTRAVSWGDLPDASKQGFEDPFAALDFEILVELGKVARIEEQLAQDTLGPADRLEAERHLSDSRMILEAEGVDVDGLLAQRWIVADKREAAAVSANPALDGQEVTLAGFAIAAPPDPDGTNVIYLVSMPGLCSHLPPPPPNQLVRVRIQSDWMPDRLHAPVELTGRLDISWSERMMHVVDGLVPMRASYAMEAVAVDQSASFLSEVPAGKSWSGAIADRLKQTGGR